MSLPIKCEVTTELLKKFYRFWKSGDGNLLGAFILKGLKDHDRSPMAEDPDYQAILQLENSLRGLSEMNHSPVQVHFVEEAKAMVQWEATAKHTGLAY